MAHKAQAAAPGKKHHDGKKHDDGKSHDGGKKHDSGEKHDEAKKHDGNKGKKTAKTGLVPIKDVWMPVLGLILGLVLGVAQDVVKHEYEYRTTTPRVRFTQTTGSPVESGGKWVEEITVTFHASGRAEVPSLTVTLDSSDPDTTVTGLPWVGSPSYSPPNVDGIPVSGSNPSFRALRVTKLHEPQFVTWRIRAERTKPFTGPPDPPKFYGVNDIQDEGQASWTEKFSTPLVATILFVYAVVATLTAFLLYLLYKRDRKKKEAT